MWSSAASTSLGDVADSLERRLPLQDGLCAVPIPLLGHIVGSRIQVQVPTQVSARRGGRAES